jgi:hypothetical protein
MNYLINSQEANERTLYSKTILEITWIYKRISLVRLTFEMTPYSSEGVH